MVTKKQLRRLGWCLVVALLLLLPGASDQTNPPISEGEIWSDMRDLIRIPINDALVGQTISDSVRVAPSKISGAVGNRHIQFSVVTTDPSSSKIMQQWDSNAIRVEVEQKSSGVPLRPSTTPFYLHSQTGNGATGLQFDPVDDALYQVRVHFLSNPYPAHSELLLKPNWDNPSFLKDRIVVAMVSKDLSRVFGWVQFGAMLVIAACTSMLFWYSTRD